MRRGLPVVWKLVKPLVVYYAGYYIAYMAVMMLLSGGSMAGILRQEKAVLGGICMLGGGAALLPMIAEERDMRQKERKKNRDRSKNIIKWPVLQYFLLLIYAVSVSVFMNMAVGFLGLAEKSDSFQEIAERQYAVSLGMGFILYAVISAIVEEVLFRFLLYNRLRRSCGKVIYGMVVSAFLFGAYHGNIVQGCYAFVLGILITLSYLYFDSFLAPVLFHGAANAVIFFCNMVPEAYAAVFTTVNFILFGFLAAAGTVFAVHKMRACQTGGE